MAGAIHAMILKEKKNGAKSDQALRKILNFLDHNRCSCYSALVFILFFINLLGILLRIIFKNIIVSGIILLGNIFLTNIILGIIFLGTLLAGSSLASTILALF